MHKLVHTAKQEKSNNVEKKKARNDKSTMLCLKCLKQGIKLSNLTTCVQDDTSGEYKRTLLKLCGGDDE